MPPRFRIRREIGLEPAPVLGDRDATLETERPGGGRQIISFADRGAFLESIEEIPEPHEFKAHLRLVGLDHADVYELDFVEHEHGGASSASAAGRDNNMRADFVHVAADAAVSVLAICELLLGRFLAGSGWTQSWASSGNWSSPTGPNGLIRDTGGVLLDMNPDKAMAEELRRTIESDGDHLADLHVWRLGPVHLGAIISILTARPRDAEFYRSRLSRFRMLSHVTIEVRDTIVCRKAAKSCPPALG